MKERSFPYKIYVDWGRDRTIVWTDTNEVFSLIGTIEDICNAIYNLVMFEVRKYRGSECDTVIRQGMRVAVDSLGVGSEIINILENKGIRVDKITNGSWLKEYTKPINKQITMDVCPYLKIN